MNDDGTRVRPIAIAEECYRHWGGLNFFNDLAHYHLHGIVVSRPDIFLMAKAIEDPEPKHAGEVAWFIRMFVGDMAELVPALPPYPIKWIRFCRMRKDGTLKEKSWPIERAAELGALLQRRN
jgi:hypothetical protein